MTTTIEHDDVRSYTARVAAQLDDLPEAERQDLLADLEQHLLEVAAEADGDLAERLGPPEAYAAELRAVAGIPSRGQSAGRPLLERLAGRVARSGPGRYADALASARSVRAVMAFLPELRPGWWVLRGYLAVVALTVLWGGYPANELSRVLVPSVYSPVVGLALIALAMWASVALGRRVPSSKAVRRFSAVLSLGVIVLAWAAVGHVEGRVVPIEALGSGESYPPYLQHSDGSPITNLCPYAADGSPLFGVLLFDQSGRPIEELAPLDEVYGEPYAEDVPRPSPQPSVAVVSNSYPRPEQIPDPVTGSPVDFHCPQVLARGAGSPTG
jgi:hypothetical protein